MAGTRTRPKYGAGHGLDAERLMEEFHCGQSTVDDTHLEPDGSECTGGPDCNEPEAHGPAEFRPPVGSAPTADRYLSKGGDPSLSKRHRRALRRLEARRAARAD
jgi:hypothetical protein